MKKIVACSHAPTLIEVIDGVSYYCADRSGALEFNGDAVINLTGLSMRPQLSHIPELAAHVQVLCEEIIVAWPDYGTPMVRVSFWQALHDYMRDGKGWRSVCFHCGAGHGRTGTAMCAMFIAVLGWEASQAVSYMRLAFCDDAVETQSQCEYLCMLDKELNGHETLEKEMPIGSAYMRAEEWTK